MSDLTYGKCPYCGRAMSEDHRCWQKPAIASLQGQFNDPDLLKAEIERLAAELSDTKILLDNWKESQRVTEAELEQTRAELRWLVIKIKKLVEPYDVVTRYILTEADCPPIIRETLREPKT